MGVTWENDGLAGPLQTLVGRLYARFRARGSDRDSAVEQAAELAAASLGCGLDRARQAAALVAGDRRRAL